MKVISTANQMLFSRMEKYRDGARRRAADETEGWWRGSSRSRSLGCDLRVMTPDNVLTPKIQRLVESVIRHPAGEVTDWAYWPPPSSLCLIGELCMCVLCCMWRWGCVSTCSFNQATNPRLLWSSSNSGMKRHRRCKLSSRRRGRDGSAAILYN